MNESFKSEIRGLISSYKSLLTKIKNEGKGKDDFAKWVTSNGYDQSGFKPSTIYRRRQKLREVLEDSDNSTFKEDYIEIVNENKNHLHLLEPIVSDYLEQIVLESNTDLKRTWYVYHFDNKDNLDQEPKLARLVLRTTGKGKANLSNIDSGSDYTGRFYKTKNKTIFFNLRSEEDDREALSGAHIRAYFKDLENDKILLGAYITYEGHRIVNGSVVLQSIKNNSDAKPLSLSFNHNSEEFFKVDWAIRKYLSLKRYNHSSTRNDIQSIDRLKIFLDKNVFQKKESRFIEYELPKVFIANPKMAKKFDKEISKDNVILQKLKEDLDKRFNPNEKSKKINFLKQDSIFKSLQNEPFPITLAPLQRTRFFILIYTGSEQGSFTLVELGWALAHSKTVMVFYKEGTLSERILTLYRMGVTFIPFNNLETDMKKIIYPKIEKEIILDLGKYIPSS